MARETEGVHARHKIATLESGRETHSDGFSRPSKHVGYIERTLSGTEGIDSVEKDRELFFYQEGELE
jgi:hypothetical protein